MIIDMPKLVHKTKRTDPDDVLTEMDLTDIEKARKEYAAGETVSWKEVKKRLGVGVRRSAQ